MCDINTPASVCLNCEREVCVEDIYDLTNKYCEVCGKPFTANQSRQKHCSDTCYAYAHRRIREGLPVAISYDRHCVYCDKDISHMPLKSIYCGSICRNRAWIQRNKKDTCSACAV